MNLFTGRSASGGLCTGRAFIYRQQTLEFETCTVKNTDKEINRLNKSFDQAFGELARIKDSFSDELGEDYGHIFRAQMTMIEDDEFKAEIAEIINRQQICAEAALKMIFEGYSEAFSCMDEDDYNRQRLADLNDVYTRILRNLLGLPENSLAEVPPESIVVAEDLMPSDTAKMNRANTAGIITEKGGVTSHVAILSKSLGIPAAVGVSDICSRIQHGEEAFLDTTDPEKAVIFTSPSIEERNSFNDKLIKQREHTAQISLMKNLKPVTEDGREIILSANIGSIEDLENALTFGAKSVGLLRTEFFFLDTTVLPDEEKQFNFYKSAAEKLDGGMLIVRTLDIGGDKEVKCFELPEEENPFLGLRGIRVSLKYREIFKTQLRAILRASVFGNIKIMFPMVADLSELIEAKKLITEIRAELSESGIKFSESVEIGTMVETPAAVLLSDLLTREGDFISLGTNDLTQYLLCADRINEDVSSYYRMFSPAVFRAIRQTAEAAHKNGKWAGVCGELGGNALAIPLLVGLGIDELSMTASMIPEAISIIRSLKYSDCKTAADKVLLMTSEDEIKDYLKSLIS